MWKPIIALYEWTVSVQLTVTLAFWLVEIPAMGLRGDFYSLDFINWFALMYNHIVPILFVYAEWRFSSIEIAWVRYPFYFLVGIAYLLMMVFSQKNLSEPIYAAFDWDNEPVISSVVACVILVQQVFSFGMVKLFTDKKLDDSGLPPGWKEDGVWDEDLQPGEI